MNLFVMSGTSISQEHSRESSLKLPDDSFSEANVERDGDSGAAFFSGASLPATDSGDTGPRGAIFRDTGPDVSETSLSIFVMPNNGVSAPHFSHFVSCHGIDSPQAGQTFLASSTRVQLPFQVRSVSEL